jgi:NADH-quinone oxidoreductase subunit M
MNQTPWITLLTATPLVGACLLGALRGRAQALARTLALAFSFVALAQALFLGARFDTAAAGLQFVERHAWVPTLGIDYFVGIDGLSLLMVLLTALVMPMALLASGRVEERASLYFALLLFLQAGLFGTFTALNFFHWFIFWELSLVPAFFLIKLWGGPQRTPAATQFFVYTMVGSIPMLLAFLGIYQATGTFDLIRLAELGRAGELANFFSVRLGWYGLSQEQLALALFGLVLVGFAVKVPLMPLHTWLPMAYAEAPSPVTMVLTGLMSKMGVYGFLRLLAPLFPDQLQAMRTPLLWLAVITVVFSAGAAVVQQDLKRLLAYSSINHLGYCLLGVFAAAGRGMDLWPMSGQAVGGVSRLATEQAAALNGVVLQMFNHGLTAATLFCGVSFLERRTGGRRGLEDFGGLRKVAPVFCGLMGIATFASLGLPGLNGFVGEFLIFKGVFALASWAAVLSTLGLLVTAVFLLTFLQRVFHGPLNAQWTGFADLTWSERLVLLPATALMFVLGVYPQLAIGLVNSTVIGMVEQPPL